MTTRVAGLSTKKTETIFEHQAWKILLGVCFMIGFFGLADMAGGASDLQKGETALMHSLAGMS